MKLTLLQCGQLLIKQQIIQGHQLYINMSAMKNKGVTLSFGLSLNIITLFIKSVGVIVFRNELAL